LDARKIVQTVERLVRRIDERFPSASLVGVARELERIARESVDRVEAIQRPNLPLRIGVWLLLMALAGLLVIFVPQLRLNMQIQAIGELVQTIEALLESLFFIGTGILFLVTIEGRLKRRRTLAVVHELRSLAHIVDMHQLTKDPEQIAGVSRTASSPKRTLTDLELVRYLDYCSELLALISKVGALYVQRLADPVVLDAVDEIEDLTTGLSRKVWQKILIIDQVRSRGQPAPAPRRRPLGAGSSGGKRRVRTG
jgi:hypothetical protein